jgi:hypothetical protein
MRAAKQQAEDLDQAGTFLGSLLSPGAEPPKHQSPAKEPSQKHSNGRVKAPKVEHVTRFAEPPAPPPQQPLPEKPDSAKASPLTTSFSTLLKRGDTAKQSNSNSNSPTNSQNTQMLSLIEALSVAKKELDQQSLKVELLEDALKRERSARKEAEEKARQLEQQASSRPVSAVEEDMQTPVQTQNVIPGNSSSPKASDAGTDKTKSLQQNLDQVLNDMARLKADMDKFQRRAETAESEAANARQSLAEMIEKIRAENEKAESSSQSRKSPSSQHTMSDDAECEISRDTPNPTSMSILKSPHMNGHAISPRLPTPLQNALTTVLRNHSENVHSGDPQAMAQSAPYVSMLGVVLIGVGLMAYLNSWQKNER